MQVERARAFAPPGAGAEGARAISGPRREFMPRPVSRPGAPEARPAREKARRRRRESEPVRAGEPPPGITRPAPGRAPAGTRRCELNK